MNSLILVTGGARSGKSSFAEDLAKKQGNSVVYIATAIPFDEGMKHRIKMHINSRPKEWKTIEQYKDFDNLKENIDFKNAQTALLDCITIMIANLMLDSGIDFDNCSMEEIDGLEISIKKETEVLLQQIKITNKTFIIVTNEIGMGLVPNNKLGNYYRDIVGRINANIARQAESVYFTVSGIPQKIK